MKIHLHPDPAIIQRLDAVAAATRRSRDDLATQAIERFLEDHERFVRSVEEAIAQADAGGPFIAHEDVVAEANARWGNAT